MAQITAKPIVLKDVEKRSGLERRQFCYSCYIPERRRQERRLGKRKTAHLDKNYDLTVRAA